MKHIKEFIRYLIITPIVFVALAMIMLQRFINWLFDYETYEQ